MIDKKLSLGTIITLITIVGTYIYRQRCLNESSPEIWGDGDSLDREHVRDIILDTFDLKWDC